MGKKTYAIPTLVPLHVTSAVNQHERDIFVGELTLS